MPKGLRNFGIILLITAGLLLLLEGMTRLFWNQSSGTIILSSHKKAMMIDSQEYTYRFVPGVKYRSITPEFTVDYTINGEGMRDAHSYLDKPRDTSKIRILAIGDSFTFGVGSEEGDTWLAKLEKQLNVKGKSIEIIKAGIPGFDQWHEYKYLSRLIGPYKPDYVMLGFLPNDLVTNKTLGENTAPGNLMPSESAENKSVFTGLQIVSLAKHILLRSDAVYRTLYEKHDGAKYMKKETRDSGKIRRQFEVTARLLVQIDSLCGTHNVPLIVVSIPQFYQVIAKDNSDFDYTIIDSYFQPVADKYKFSWITTIPEFRSAYAAGTQTHYRVDGHLTPACNEVLANAVSSKLKTVLK